MKKEMSNNVQLNEESPPTQMINNNFPVRPVYDKEMTKEERTCMKNRSVQILIPDVNFVLEDEGGKIP